MAAQARTIITAPCTIITDIRCAGSMEALREVLQQHMKHDGYIVSWQVPQVLWGRWEQGILIWADGSDGAVPFINELRVFNDTEELHIYHDGDGFAGRYIADGQGDREISYIDATAPLTGSQGKAERPGFVVLKEAQRKYTMTIPADIVADTYYLTTRNYIYIQAETGQAGYGEYRFVALSARREA